MLLLKITIYRFFTFSYFPFISAKQRKYTNEVHIYEHKNAKGDIFVYCNMAFYLNDENGKTCKYSIANIHWAGSKIK